MSNEAIPTGKLFQDITGKTFGRLFVIGYSHAKERKNGRAFFWKCRCECGKEFPEIKAINGACLKRGTSRSCGCLQNETRHLADHGHAKQREGGRTTRIYRIWRAMLTRCNPVTAGDHHQKYYVQRGITVCERWKLFNNFLADMGEPPTSKHSIDRIDNDSGYEPGNCQWATQKEQVRKSSSTTMIACRGQIRCIAEWSEISGVPSGRISSRLLAGWDAEKAVFTPPIISTKNIRYQ